MEEQSSSFQKKRIHVNAASLVDLKAALSRKKQEVRNATKSTGSGKVSEKTASIWRKQPKKRTTTEHATNSSKTSTQVLSSQNELDLARSKAALEAKVVLYNKLSREGDLSNSSDEDDDKPRIMVDFQRKIYEKVAREREQQLIIDSKPSPPTLVIEADNKTTDSENEWVDYTDSLGRSRRCLKKDLSEMLSIDQQMESQQTTRHSRSSSPDLLSEDMRRERERQKWEEDAYRETVMDETREDYNVEQYEQKEMPVHYQSVRQEEIRDVGVGYYSFDVDEERRQEQMKTLNKLREDTKDQRIKRDKLKEKRKTILEAKLAKVRQRKLQQTGADNDTNDSRNMTETNVSSEIANFNFTNTKETNLKNDDVTSTTPESLEDLIEKQVTDARRKMEAEERKKHKRPWDRGKMVDSIRTQKKVLQDERLPEFAPPSSYKKPHLPAYPPPPSTVQEMSFPPPLPKLTDQPQMTTGQYPPPLPKLTDQPQMTTGQYPPPLPKLTDQPQMTTGQYPPYIPYPFHIFPNFPYPNQFPAYPQFPTFSQPSNQTTFPAQNQLPIIPPSQAAQLPILPQAQPPIPPCQSESPIPTHQATQPQQPNIS